MNRSFAWMSWLAASVVVQACLPKMVTRTLANVPKAGVHVVLSDPRLNSANGSWTAALQLWSDLGNECLEFHGQATIDGFPLAEATTGAVACGSKLAACGCVPPSWLLPDPLPVEDVTSFTISDSTGAISGSFRQLGTARAIALDPVSPSPLHWGQTAMLDWTPATDQLVPQDINLWFTTSVASYHIAGPADPTQSLDGTAGYDGGAITFVVPAVGGSADGGADGQLQVSMSQGAMAQVVSCSAVHCEADVAPLWLTVDAGVVP